jgi:glycine hydroxymethyltransferase
VRSGRSRGVRYCPSRETDRPSGSVGPAGTVATCSFSPATSFASRSLALYEWPSSGRLYQFVHYGVHPDTGIIDYDHLKTLAGKHRPKMIVAGASAYPRIIDFKRFADIAVSVGAYLMVDMAHIAGLVAAGVHPSPIPYADVTTSTTHKTLRGPRGGLILSKADYGRQLNKEIFPGIQGGPLMHVIAAKAAAFQEALSDEFKAYQIQTVKNARALSEHLMAGGVNLVSGGTDNHMLLADLRNLSLTGKDAEAALGLAGITVNKNSVPFDTLGPATTSGVRMGTPALTTRGMQEPEMALVAKMILDVLQNIENKDVLQNINSQARELCSAFPIFEGEGFRC